MFQEYTIDLDNYQKIKKIGEGSYGIAYLVQDVEKRQEIVAKETKIECTSEQDKKKFYTEISAFLKAISPSILKFYGFSMTNFEGEHYPILFTEYMPKGSLDKTLKKGDIPLSRKYIILVGVAYGMKCLHENGVIHRDLKPENVLLDDKLYPRICDFGESYVSDLTLSSIIMQTFKGTASYMAPEIIKDDDSYTYKVDVFSFSMLMYELISGKAPFNKGKNAFKILTDIEKGIRPDLSIIKDERVCCFISKCWSNNPNDRPNFNEIIQELQEEYFMNYMQADKTEVSKYLQLFKKQACDVKPTNIQKETIVKKDPMYLKMKADEGDPVCMLNYGLSLEHGRNGVTQNKKEALKYFKMSADKGNVRGMFNYCLLMLSGIEGVEKNEEEAIAYCKRSAEMGYPASMSYYGSILSHGTHGVTADKKLAAHFFKMAADKGNVKAMNSYAAMLRKGIGVEINKEESLRYFQMAADKGNATAMNNLSIFLLEKGDPTLHKAAARYCKMAADKGNVLAMHRYSRLLKEGTGVDVNEEEAAHYAKLAEEARKNQIKSK